MNRYLTLEEKKEIINLAKKNYTQSQISKKLKRSNTTIFNFALKENIKLNKSDNSIWSKDDLKIIKSRKRIEDLCILLPNHSKEQIISKLRKLKITLLNTKHAEWSNDEDLIIFNHIEKDYKIKDLINKLPHRTLRSIYARVNTLGLTKYNTLKDGE